MAYLERQGTAHHNNKPAVLMNLFSRFGCPRDPTCQCKYTEREAGLEYEVVHRRARRHVYDRNRIEEDIDGRAYCWEQHTETTPRRQSRFLHFSGLHFPGHGSYESCDEGALRIA